MAASRSCCSRSHWGRIVASRCSAASFAAAAAVSAARAAANRSSAAFLAASSSLLSGKSRPEPFEPGTKRGALFLEPILRGPEPLVPQHPGEKLGALGRTHRGHDRELFLAGEVGVEELVASHPHDPGDMRGHAADAVLDRVRIIVLVELRR